MSKSLLNKNLASLKKIDPTLYEKITSVKISNSFEVIKSKSGIPTLVHIDSEGNQNQIYSNYDPIGEATRYLETFKIDESINFIVAGLGLGYQVMELIRKTSIRAKIFIFEKDPELFALAIREVDFSSILNHPGVKIFIDASPFSLGDLLEPEQINFTLNGYRLIKQKSLVDRNLKYYGVLLEEIDNYFLGSQINLKTQINHSKLFYKNIFSNLQCFIASPGIKSLKKCLRDVPAIICSAGPSLDKNIQLLKSARERFYLIAVATALKPLLCQGIQPDVVICIDPDDLTIHSFDFQKDYGDYWLVFNPAVPSAIPNAFPKRRLAFDSEIYLAQWFRKYTEEKGDLGKVTSVAHSAVQLAQYLACFPIILVGQDLSFCKQRLHCSNSFYFENNMDKVTQLNPLLYWDNLKYLNFGPNLTQGIDLFGCSVVGTIAMDSYNHIFSQSLDDFNAVINASEGGVPIKGIKNLLLREAIHLFCQDSIKDKLNSLIPQPVIKGEVFNSLQDSTLKQVKYLKELSGKLNRLESQFLVTRTPGPEGKQEFLNEMDILYKNILENEETALLLQGHDFSGFSTWYCSNNQILRKKELSQDSSLLDEEFERDLKFFDVLVESVDYLIVHLKKPVFH